MAYPRRPLPIGTKINKLTLINEVPTNSGRRYVYCECECGSKKVIRYDGLRSGRIKSCGCLVSVKNASQTEKMLITRRHNKEKVIISNYIGKQFSRLQILSIYRHPKNPGTWFNAVCKCGNQIIVSLTKLKIKHTQSCGCIRRKYTHVFISSIDGEELIVSSGKLQYLRILHSRELLHIYEAKKAYKILGKEWNNQHIIHHIDGNKHNNELSNLAIMNSSSHHKHHKQMERAMYAFLHSNQLLDSFYETNPQLLLTSLHDELNAK